MRFERDTAADVSRRTHVVACHDGLLTLHSAECLALNYIHANMIEFPLQLRRKMVAVQWPAQPQFV